MRRAAVRKSDKFGTDDVQPGQPQTAEVATEGPAMIRLDDVKVEVAPASYLRDKAAYEAFMNEPVVIQIEESDDPNAPLFVHSGNNGVDQYIQRGVEQTIRRKFLYSLVAAKKSDWSCSFGRDQGGNEFNRMAKRQRTTHRLHVVRDDNPRGREEFNRWMQEP